MNRSFIPGKPKHPKLNLIRKGLEESLEQYAERNHISVDIARAVWRSEGLRLLEIGDQFQLGPLTSCRIAPNVAIPTKKVVL